MAPDAVEILVHVAAPCTAAADAAYRRLAHAYLSFRPAARSRLPGSPDGDDGAAAESPPAEPPPGFETPAAGPVFFGPESQELSFQSALGNLSSPRLPPAAPEPPPSVSQASFCPPPSQISDSYPLPASGVLTATPTRILQRFLGDARDSQAESVDIPSSIPVLPSRLRHRPADAPPPQVVPVTPLAPLPPPRKRKASVAELDDGAFDVTHVSSSDASRHAPPTPSPSRAESEPPPAQKRPRTAGDADSAASVALTRSTSDTGPARRPPPALDGVASSCEIRPPSPPVGTALMAPADLVSDKLAKLARDLSSRYRPAVRRPPRPLERGYWLLDCAAWPPQTRRDTWVFLSNYLGSGLAGWGVWCRRDAAPDGCWLRLYCWACVAKHTYLLLYLASARHVKATGARWLDADGDVVLEVAPCERRP